MAKQLLNLMDLAARRGSDKEIGLVQQIINWSPEITTISGRTIPGTFTEAKVQVAIPKGGAFPGNNSGVAVGAGAYERRRFNAFFFDSQLEIRESEVVAAEQAGDSIGDLQADEVAGALQDKAIKFSQQFYAGLAINPNGFPGLLDIIKIYNGNFGASKNAVIDSRTGQPIVNWIDAGGTSGATECVWYIWQHNQGIHFLFGGNKMLDVNPWVWAYLGASDSRYRAQVSNISGFIGLSAANPWCVACIKNIDAAHPWTDAISAKLHALLPMGIQPTHCFATKRAIAGLQQSRTVTLFGQQSARPDQPTIAPIPKTDVEGITIYPTDGIQLSKTI
jgi:hypothetical protein